MSTALNSVVFFRYKFPLTANNMNQLFSNGFYPGILKGLEVRKHTATSFIINIGSSFIYDAVSGLLVKINHNTTTIVAAPNIATGYTRIIMWYQYDDSSTSNTVNIDIIKPDGTGLPVGVTDYVILGDIVADGGNIDYIEYSSRTYSIINDEFLSMVLPSNIGLRYDGASSGVKLKLVYNNRPSSRKFRIENIGNVNATRNPTSGAGSLVSDTEYYAFLCLDKDDGSTSTGQIILMFYGASVADWDSETQIFNKVSEDYPLHKFIGQFKSGNPTANNVLPNSIYDSFLESPRGDIRMFSGVSLPLGWKICDGQDGSPDLRSRFIVGVDDRTPVAWQTSTAYSVGDLVSESGSYYYCIQSHTSGTFSTDRTANKWTEWDLNYNNPRYVGGENKHKLIPNELAAHTHTDSGHVHNDPQSSNTDAIKNSPVTNGNNDNGFNTGIGYANIQNNSTTELPHENRPLFYSLYYAIKI